MSDKEQTLVATARELARLEKRRAALLAKLTEAARAAGVVLAEADEAIAAKRREIADLVAPPTA